jgi:GNAT superfamily N-acetyltransferase
LEKPAVNVIQLEQLSLDELEPLMVESRERGFDFVERLAAEYADGSNRFDRPGEALFGVYSGHSLIAVGGLNRDPYLRDGETGRVRHVYVLSAWRRQGAGTLLIRRIVEEAKPTYRRLTLRTLNPEADRFYRSLGFQTEPPVPHATHHLDLFTR